LQTPPVLSSNLQSKICNHQSREVSLAHLVQVGAGSGGMPVLDMVCRDPGITRLTLIEPDVYKPHNVERHLFPAAAVGRSKAELAEEWLHARRPGLEIKVLLTDLCAPAAAAEIDRAAASADVGICAADNEQAKLHWDALMRRHQKPWTLGEVLSGGIGGFVHWFVPGGPCYGCVASHLKRSLEVEKPKAPDYSQPGGAAPEVTIPASKASIGVIAGLHAMVTLQLLGDPRTYDPGFTSMLFTLERVPEIFEEMYRPFRFRIARSPTCLVCGGQDRTPPQDLDAALEEALGRVMGDR
jgi:molybdopterin/thiamine biosynthesis adenylyltransferase